MQIFLSAPQRGQQPRHSDEQVDEFCRLVAEAGIGPNYAHATYLTNLATTDPGIRQRTVDNLRAYTAWADRIGLAGIVVHVGSGRGQPLPEAEVQGAAGLAKVLPSGLTRVLV